MVKKLSKVLGVALCIFGVASSYKVFAQSSKYYNVTRIFGESRYETSANISEAFESKEVKSVIIANGSFFPDSLAGSVLSKKLNAPILLASNGTSYDDWSVESYIYRHLPKDGTIYILGGEASISSDYLNRFYKQGYKNFKRLGGTNRFGTNSAIVDEMNVQTGTPVVLVNGLNFPDALSISSIAASKGYPILMNMSDAIPDEILQKLTSIKPSKVYMIGGTTALSDNIKTEVENTLSYINDQDIVRISGDNRFETSINVCSYFKLDSQSVVISNGLNFPDALSGSALAAKLNSPILLTDGRNIAKQKDYIDSTSYSNVIILGGESSVNSTIEDEFYGTKLKSGGSFPEYSDNKIIDFKNGDVNGDGNNENVILTYDSNNKGMLFIQDSRNGQVIGSKAFDDYTSHYGEIILADVDGDKIDDIMSIIESGGTSAMQTCDIETFKNNSLNLIGEWSYEKSTFKMNEDDLTFSLSGWDTMNIRSATFNKNYSIDLTSDEFMQWAKSNGSEVDPYVGHGPRFSVNDADNDGVYEVRVYEDISGECHADVLGGFYTYYKYSNSSWKLVKLDVESIYPVKEE